MRQGHRGEGERALPAGHVPGSMKKCGMSRWLPAYYTAGFMLAFGATADASGRGRRRGPAPVSVHRRPGGQTQVDTD